MIPQTEKTYYGYTKIQLLCCMVCYICFLVFGAADTSKSVYLPLIQKFYHLEYDYQGLFVFTASIGYITLSLFVGYLVVRLGIKITLIMGLSILIISMLGATFFVNIWVLLGFLIIGGCGSVFIDVGSNTWGTMLFQHHKAVMMNILHFFYGLGAAIGPTYTGWASLLIDMDYRGVFISVLILLVVGLIAVLCIPKQQSVKDDEEGADPNFTILSALKDPAVYLLGLAQGCIAGTENITTNWSPIYFRDLYGWDVHTKGAHFVTLFFAVYSISRAVSGFLIDAIGEIKSLMLLLFSVILLYILGFCLGEKGAIVLISTGAFVAPLFPTFLTVAMLLFKRNVSKCTCVILLFYMIISQVVQYFVGLICKYMGVQWGYRFVVILMATVLVDVFVLSCILKKREKKEQNDATVEALLTEA